MSEYIKIFLIFLFLFLPLSVIAEGDLIVNFSSDPLFSIANFVPGQSISGLVEVRNNSGQTKKIAVEAINVLGVENLSSVFGLRITHGTDILFEDSLNVFLGSGEIFLSDLENNTSTIYEFIINFDNQSNNELQGKSLENFDLLIGFLGEEKISIIQGNSNNSSGGAGGILPGLTISQQYETEIQATQVIIKWLTGYKSTSRVIYSPIDEAHLFDFNNLPNYGYVYSTAEQDAPANMKGVISHKVVLNNLKPNTKYYYRTISHASPDTISKEHSFVTKKNEIEIFKEKIEFEDKNEDVKITEQILLPAKVDSGQVAGEQTKEIEQIEKTQEIIKISQLEDLTQQQDKQDKKRFSKYVITIIVFIVFFLILIILFKFKKFKFD